MNHAQWRQFFYQSLTQFYVQSELMSLYHWVMEEEFGWNRSQLYLHNQENLEPEDLERLSNVIKRLAAQEPIQHIYGKAFFFDLELEVSPDVLIPRPETEELVELVLNTYGNETKVHLVDIGTGSGCIPLAIKKYRPNWEVSGMDVSTEALLIASKNANKLGLDVHFAALDVLNQPISNCDIIISNPPYIPEAVKNEMEKNVVDYEPSLALFVPNEDPFVFFKAIISQAEKIGVKAVFFETHATHMDALINELTPYWKGDLVVKNDLSGKPRFVVGLKKS